MTVAKTVVHPNIGDFLRKTILGFLSRGKALVV